MSFDCYFFHRPTERELLHTIIRRLNVMALTQQDFDTELADLVAAIGNLNTAVDALLASQPAGTDLSAEGQSVVDAKAAIQAELDKINPSTTPPAA